MGLVASEYLAFELSQHPHQEQAQRIATPLRLAKTVVRASASVTLALRLGKRICWLRRTTGC